MAQSACTKTYYEPLIHGTGYWEQIGKIVLNGVSTSVAVPFKQVTHAFFTCSNTATVPTVNLSGSTIYVTAAVQSVGYTFRAVGI